MHMISLYAKRAFAALCCVCLLLVCVPPVAEAVQVYPQEEKITLTVYYEHDDCFVSNALVSIYRVADIKEDGTLQPVDEIASYPINWDVTDASSAQDLANTLESYLVYASRARLALPVADQAATDSNGVAMFPSSGETLEPGYYLVTAEPQNCGDEYLEASSSLLALPYGNGAEGVDYTPGISLKLCSYDRGRLCTIDVSKVWSNDKADKRPESVSITLLCDGVPFDFAVLSQENGWHAAWAGLDSGSQWMVVENEVPDGYAVIVKRDGTFFTVENTYVKQEEPTPDDPAPKPPMEELPQTGVLWWPVPVLLVLGIALLFVGSRRSGKDGLE